MKCPLELKILLLLPRGVPLWGYIFKGCISSLLHLPTLLHVVAGTPTETASKEASKLAQNTAVLIIKFSKQGSPKSLK